MGNRDEASMKEIKYQLYIKPLGIGFRETCVTFTNHHSLISVLKVGDSRYMAEHGCLLELDVPAAQNSVEILQMTMDNKGPIWDDSKHELINGDGKKWELINKYPEQSGQVWCELKREVNREGRTKKWIKKWIERKMKRKKPSSS